jgi:hypothetical protein
MRQMMPSRLFRCGAALFGLLCFAALGTPGSAQQPGRGPKLPDNVKLEADIPYAGTDNPRQRLNLLLPRMPKDDRPMPVIAYIHGGSLVGRRPCRRQRPVGLRGVAATISEETIPNQ